MLFIFQVIILPPAITCRDSAPQTTTWTGGVVVDVLIHAMPAGGMAAVPTSISMESTGVLDINNFGGYIVVHGSHCQVVV